MFSNVMTTITDNVIYVHTQLDYIYRRTLRGICGGIYIYYLYIGIGITAFACLLLFYVLATSKVTLRRA